MSTVTLFYGQCGNQISESFFANLHEDLNNSRKDVEYKSNSISKWFNVTKTKKLIPRTLLIDTESKTVPRQNTNYHFKNIVAKSFGGSANNWAFGYYQQSKLLLPEIEDYVRKEMEKTDFEASFLNVFSSSGGTGAGVGSAVIEILKNNYPKTPITNVIVLPYSNGEIVTQSYNNLLVLSKIYSLCDSFLFFENDRLHYNCINSLNIKNVNFDDINNLISRQLLSVFQPLKSVQSSDLLSKLCENEMLKLLQIKLAPVSKLEISQNWNSLMNSISRQTRFDIQQKNQNKFNLKLKTFAAALICRGLYNPAENDLKSFKELSYCQTVDLYHHKRKFFNLDNCLSVVSNNNSVIFPLSTIYQDSNNLYKYGAYLHHYRKYGVDDLHFESSFEIFKTILENYETM